MSASPIKRPHAKFYVHEHLDAARTIVNSLNIEAVGLSSNEMHMLVPSLRPNRWVIGRVAWSPSTDRWKSLTALSRINVFDHLLRTNRLDLWI